MEIWVKIKDYDGYEVSNLGNVRSITRIVQEHSKKRKRCFTVKGKILKQQSNWAGYLKVRLNGRKGKAVSVHRLVGKAFLDNPQNLPLICHIDDNPSNNNAENLFWGTHSDNMKDMYRKNRGNNFKGELSPNSKKVFQYNLKGELIKIWSFLYETKKHGFEPTQISRCCRRLQISHKDFIWSYKELDKSYFCKIKIGKDALKKEIYQYNLNGDFIEKHDSISSLKCKGFAPTNVIACCKGITKSHKGFFWSYSKTSIPNNMHRWNTMKKQIVAIDKNGVIVKKYRSITEASKDGFYHTPIIKCLRGELDSYKELKWAYPAHE